MTATTKKRPYKRGIPLPIKQELPPESPPKTTPCDDGGPAFPFGTYILGISIRDYFAAKSFAAMVSNGVPSTDESVKTAATLAYMMADAMLAARKR